MFERRTLRLRDTSRRGYDGRLYFHHAPRINRKYFIEAPRARIGEYLDGENTVLVTRVDRKSRVLFSKRISLPSR